MKMNKEKVLLYFKKNEKIVDHKNNNEVKIINVTRSSSCDIKMSINSLVAKEIQKLCKQ